MDRSVCFTLLAKTYTVDSIGQRIEATTSNAVYGRVESITRAEWSAASTAGFKPELKIVMFAPDYNGEDEAVVDGVNYGVYRTFRASNDKLELYLEKKAGV